jgi:hypothetical protein
MPWHSAGEGSCQPQEIMPISFQNEESAMNLKTLSAMALTTMLMLTSASAAQSANCGYSFLRKLQQQAYNLQRISSECSRVTSGNSNNIAQMCRACRGTTLQILSLDRLMRNHRSCIQDAEGRKLLYELSQARSQLNFVRRGCGF